MKIRVLLIGALSGMAGTLSAQQGGTYAFLNMDAGARAGALNGSFVSTVDDPNVIFYNPAALPTLMRPAASLGYLNHLLDVNAGSLSYAQNVEGIGSVGGGIRFVDYGTFERTDESMNTLGTFGALELALSVGWGTYVDVNTSVGASIEFVHSSLAEYRSSALAMCAGVLYRIPSENLTLGASVLHLGSQLSTYAGTREPLPLEIKIGLTKRPEHLPVNLSLNFHKLNERRDSILDHFSSFSVGAEFLLTESINLRFGYNNELRRELKLGTSYGLVGFSTGVGIALGEYLVDYGFSSLGEIGALHRVSVGLLL